MRHGESYLVKEMTNERNRIAADPVLASLKFEKSKQQIDMEAYY